MSSCNSWFVYDLSLSPRRLHWFWLPFWLSFFAFLSTCPRGGHIFRWMFGLSASMGVHSVSATCASLPSLCFPDRGRGPHTAPGSHCLGWWCGDIALQRGTRRCGGVAPGGKFPAYIYMYRFLWFCLICFDFLMMIWTYCLIVFIDSHCFLWWPFINSPVVFAGVSEMFRSSQVFFRMMSMICDGFSCIGFKFLLIFGDFLVTSINLLVISIASFALSIAFQHLRHHPIHKKVELATAFGNFQHLRYQCIRKTS